jgi:hypothetical protein
MPTIYLDDRAVRRLMSIIEMFAKEHDVELSLSGAVEYIYRKYSRVENLSGEVEDTI